MSGQASDETVVHAEKVASERVLGQRHHVWDVHTDKGRWWVVTGLTNLYSQDDFKSMDGVLSFHIGLMARMTERQARESPERPEPRLERTRRQWEQAAEAQNDAEEAEEFQAVGMRCRETLVSFAHAMADDALIPPTVQTPKDSDLIAWAELVADAVAPGQRNARLRAYLKSISSRAWEYVGWAHARQERHPLRRRSRGRRTGHVLSMFEQTIWYAELGVPDRCPRCGSYRIAPDWQIDDQTEQIIQAQVCAACDWYEERERETLRWTNDPEKDRKPSPGECILSSDI